VHAQKLPHASRSSRYDAGMSDSSELRDRALSNLKAKQAFWYQLGGSVVAAVVMVLIWLLSGMGYFWPVWPIAFIVLALILSAIRIFGASGRGPTESQIQDEMRRLQ